MKNTLNLLYIGYYYLVCVGNWYSTCFDWLILGDFSPIMPLIIALQKQSEKLHVQY